MAFQDKQPVVQNILYKADGTPITIVNEAGADRLATTSVISDGTNVVSVNASGELAVTLAGGTADVFGVDFGKSGQTTDAYYMFIDVDNQAGAGPYKHAAGTAVKLHSVIGHLTKSKHSLDWKVVLAVVLRVDGTDADLAYLELSSMHTENSALFQVALDYKAAPDPLDLTVAAGSLTRIAVKNVQLNVAAVNTATPLEDVSAAGTVAPAAGDILIFSDNLNSGSGTADWHFTANYEVS